MRIYAYALLALVAALAVAAAFVAGLRWDAAQEARDAAKVAETAGDVADEVDALGDSSVFDGLLEWLRPDP